MVLISGDYSEEATPVPISNTEVKLLSADDTWREAAWESRTLPVHGMTHADWRALFCFFDIFNIFTFLFVCFVIKLKDSTR